MRAHPLGKIPSSISYTDPLHRRIMPLHTYAHDVPTHVHSHMYTCMHLLSVQTHLIDIHVVAHICICTYIYLYILVFAHTQLYTCILIHMYTYINIHYKSTLIQAYIRNTRTYAEVHTHEYGRTD